MSTSEHIPTTVLPFFVSGGERLAGVRGHAESGGTAWGIGARMVRRRA